jgi:hypothetical protein
MANLLPVIVGGLIGLAGGFIGPWFLQRAKDTSERKKHRAEKFEELVQTVYEDRFWLNNVKDIRVFGDKRDEPPSPFAKLESIAMVYFPQFLLSRPSCLNRISASISGASAGVRPPRGAEEDRSRLDPGCGRQGSNAVVARCKSRDIDQSSFAPHRRFRRLADRPPRI